jgi:hypothetical protein
MKACGDAASSVARIMTPAFCPFVRTTHTHHASDDVAVPGQRPRHEMERVGGSPDVRARPLHFESVTGDRRTSAQSHGADVLRRPAARGRHQSRRFWLVAGNDRRRSRLHVRGSHHRARHHRSRVAGRRSRTRLHRQYVSPHLSCPAGCRAAIAHTKRNTNAFRFVIYQ